jgi:hypothetical protein
VDNGVGDAFGSLVPEFAEFLLGIVFSEDIGAGPYFFQRVFLSLVIKMGEILVAVQAGRLAKYWIQHTRQDAEQK